MATFSKQFFSVGASNVLIASTNSASPTSLHTVPASATDEIWVYATNNDTASANLTLQCPSGSVAGDIWQSLPSMSGLTIIVPGLILSSSQVVSAYASIANKITLHGYVNRIS